LFIEWVYTIHLDRKIVHIKSQSAETSFELSSTPHELEWPQHFDEEEEKEAEGEGTPPPAKTAKDQAFAALLVPAAPSKS
jgi:ribosomal protein L24E